MNLTATTNAQRFARVFNRRVRILIQVTTAANVLFIGHDQGEVQSGGIGLTQASTATPSQPFKEWWEGEFWYRANVAPTNFELIIATEDGVYVEQTLPEARCSVSA